MIVLYNTIRKTSLLRLGFCSLVSMYTKKWIAFSGVTKKILDDLETKPRVLGVKLTNR